MGIGLVSPLSGREEMHVVVHHGTHEARLLTHVEILEVKGRGSPFASNAPAAMEPTPFAALHKTS